MAIDANRVTSLIDELGLEGADKDYFTKVLTSNERAATQFVGQRERHADYTKRTQALATEKAELERRTNSQVADYAKQLQDAENKIRTIMNDFENESISRATAEARLAKVKNVYNLSDDDIPAVDPQVGRRTEVNNSTPPFDIDAKLAEFEKSLLAKLTPELAAFPKVAAMLDDLDIQHHQLTGKHLTYAEKQELMEEAQKGDTGPSKPRLIRVYEDKYKVGDLQRQREIDERIKTERQKWDDELKTRNSEEALRVVQSGREQPPDAYHSPILGRQFKTDNDPAQRSFTPDSKPANDGGRTPQVQNTPKLSGAERAAQRYIERRQAGIGMGQPDPVSKK